MRLRVSLIVRLYVSIPNCNRLLCDFRTGGALLAGKPPHNPRRCLFRGLLDWALDSRLGSNELSRCRSEEHTSELQSLMRISNAVLSLKKKKQRHTIKESRHHIRETSQNNHDGY